MLLIIAVEEFPHGWESCGERIAQAEWGPLMSERKNSEKRNKAGKDKSDSKTKLPLSDVISHLRSELRKARLEGEGEEPRFLVDDAEIELQVGVTSGVDGKVGVKFWVYSAEAGGKLEQQAVQKIRLKLKPQDASGGIYKTSGTAKRRKSSDDAAGADDGAE